MWLMNYMAKKSINTPNAVKGSVKGNDLSGTSVASSGEHKMLKSCLPFGVVSVPPKGEQAVVLALDGSEVGLGVISDASGLEEGEVMLYSKGGASIVLKNNGSVMINGREF